LNKSTGDLMPFSRSVHIYDQIYTKIRNYEKQAKEIRAWIEKRNPSAISLLDVACGTGLHIKYLSKWFDVEGVDISPAMVEVSKLRNPNSSIYVGDMRDFAIEKQYDIITCLFSSITYAGDVKSLKATLRNLAKHLIPGGLCIIEPYISPDAWCDGVVGLRTAETVDQKISMVDRAEKSGRKIRREIEYLVGTPKKIEKISEEHAYFLFTRQEYENAYVDAGFSVEYDDIGFIEGRGMYFGTLIL
jgi:SAM-dependent methyltransferase